MSDSPVSNASFTSISPSNTYASDGIWYPCSNSITSSKTISLISISFISESLITFAFIAVNIDSFFTKFLPVKNFIVIESHNDFDSNGGALYDYLIEHGYNKKYKIFWLLKNKKNKGLPSNVKAFYLYKPSIKKAIIIARAKYIFTCQDCIGSSRKDQISVYLTHGGFGLKRWRGKMRLPSNLTYVLMP